MRRLWLHIGSHKTGTTTVQDTFLFNRSLLLQRGLAFVHGTAESHLHQYLASIDPKSILPAGFALTDPAAFATHLARGPADVVFASSENFSFFFTQQAVDDLAAAVRPHFDDVRILAYIRRQDRHAISHHQEGARPERLPEGVLWGHALTALPEPAAHQRLYLDYDQRLMLWENAFGRGSLHVRMYDRAHLANGDVVNDILGLMGLNEGGSADDGLVRVPDKNLALGQQKAKVGHLANAITTDALLTRSLLRALPQNDDRMLPSAEAARAFLEPYRESNRALNARLGLTPYPDLFPDSFDDYPATATDPWTEDNANSALRTVIALLATGSGYKTALTPDDLRNAAIALKVKSPESALRFIQAAQRLRPDGPNILRLLTELEQRVAEIKAPR
jgi:hypothetical protein